MLSKKKTKFGLGIIFGQLLLILFYGWNDNWIVTPEDNNCARENPDTPFARIITKKATYVLQEEDLDWYDDCKTREQKDLSYYWELRHDPKIKDQMTKLRDERFIREIR